MEASAHLRSFSTWGRFARALLLVAPLTMANAEEDEACGPLPADHHTGRLPGGAQWTARVPPDWNGTLLVWSPGYSPVVRAPEVGPEAVTADLLEQGFALLGTAWSTPGWAVADAVPEQAAAIEAFSGTISPPKRTIAWGASMGGLATVALAERHAGQLDGALALCGSIGGSLGMMNMALDGAYAFVTLSAPDDGIELVRISDDRRNHARVAGAVSRVMQSPEGRARLALAAVLAGIPDWTDAESPRPDRDDLDARIRQLAHTFAMGVFLPRTDQEARAGGVYSWNTGIDYAAQLEKSGRQPFVAAAYRRAGLDLEADLARLNAGRRIEADPTAVAYMRDHYTPTGEPGVPVLAVQKIGDGLTSPSLQRAYGELVSETGHPDRYRGLWVEQAGHCDFERDTLNSALNTIIARVIDGSWQHADEVIGEGPFVRHEPAPMLRPCSHDGACH